MVPSALLKEQSKTQRRFTYADYKDWDLTPRERYELIYGEAYAMSAPNLYHQSILTELVRQFANYLIGKPCKVYPAPFDVRLFYEENEKGEDEERDDTVVQPDISVICDKAKRGNEGCHGAPDFVAEILSPSNTAIEMERKFELYRKARVREYWVLDPEQKRLHAYRFEGGIIQTRSYGTADTAKVDIFDGLDIALEPVFAE